MPLKHKGQKKADKSFKAYDIDFMNRKELKFHISELKFEMNKMRIDLKCHTINNNKLSSFIFEKQDDYFFAKQSEAATGNQVLDSVEELKHRLKEAKIKAKTLKLKHNSEQSFELHNCYLSILSDYEKFFVKKKEAKNVERKMKEYQFLSDLASKFMIANDLSKFLALPEELTINRVFKMRKCLRDFSTAKKQAEDAYNVHPPTIPSFDGFPINVTSKIQDYFHELSHNSIKAVQIFEARLAKLQEKFWTITVAINEALKERKNIQAGQNRNLELGRSTISLSNSALKDSAELDKLLLKNDELLQELEKSKTRFNSLKSLFLSNVSKFYEKAEYRAYVAEAMLHVALAIEKYKSDASIVEKRIYGEQKCFNLTQNRQNLAGRLTKVTLTIQNSDTLFIPPQFH